MCRMGNKNPIAWSVIRGTLTLQEIIGQPGTVTAVIKLITIITMMRKRKEETRSRLMTSHFLHFPHFDPPKCGKCAKCRAAGRSLQVISEGKHYGGRRLAYER